MKQSPSPAAGARGPLHYLGCPPRVPTTPPAAPRPPGPYSRHNAYLRPRGLDRLAQGLESFDCRHLGNPQTTPVFGDAPRGCDPMEPWSLGDRPAAAFPRLTRLPE